MKIFKLSIEFATETNSENLTNFKINEEDENGDSNFIADMFSVCIIYVVFLHVIVSYTKICLG